MSPFPAMLSMAGFHSLSLLGVILLASIGAGDESCTTTASDVVLDAHELQRSGPAAGTSLMAKSAGVVSSVIPPKDELVANEPEASVLLHEDDGHLSGDLDHVDRGAPAATEPMTADLQASVLAEGRQASTRRILACLLLLCVFLGGHRIGGKHFTRTAGDANDEESLHHQIMERWRQDLTDEEVDDFGCTALHVAADRSLAIEVRKLLAGNANVNAREAWQETPLHFAARVGSLDSCKLLVESGAEVNPENESGCTPLLLAGQAGQETTCKFLLDSGGHVGGLADADLPPVLSALLVERIFDDLKGPTTRVPLDTESVDAGCKDD